MTIGCIGYKRIVYEDTPMASDVADWTHSVSDAKLAVRTFLRILIVLSSVCCYLLLSSSDATKQRVCVEHQSSNVTD